MTQQPQLCIFINTKKPETSLIMAAYQYILLYSVGGWGEGGGYVCPSSESQKRSFRVLKRRSCCSRYFTIIVLIFCDFPCRQFIYPSSFQGLMSLVGI